MLTAMQKKVLKYYEKYISENGHSPTYQQAADALKKVKSTIYVNVAQLSNKGFMRYSRNGVEIVSKSERSLENAISGIEAVLRMRRMHSPQTEEYRNVTRGIYIALMLLKDENSEDWE